MTTWKLRLEGSTTIFDNLTAQQIVEGVQNGQWETTDEVRGPNDADWKSLETHPRFAEIMAELDLPTAPPHPDETRLDMNPLIDVALVLLIFFILTTTYQELRKMFPTPPSTSDEVNQTLREGQIREFTIRLTANMESSEPVVRVENEAVPLDQLQQKLEEWKNKTGHSKLAVEFGKGVPWKVFMAVQDAAAGAKIAETLRIERTPTSRE